MKTFFISMSIFFFIFYTNQYLCADAQSLEYQLAVFNAKGYVKENDPSVAKFGFLLNKLQSKFIDNKEIIANGSAKMYDMLVEKRQIHEKFEIFFEGIYDINNKNMKVHFIDCLVGYTYFRSKLLSHNEAVLIINKTIEKDTCIVSQDLK